MGRPMGQGAKAFASGQCPLAGSLPLVKFLGDDRPSQQLNLQLHARNSHPSHFQVLVLSEMMSDNQCLLLGKPVNFKALCYTVADE